jgi:hypothetical protein
MCHILMSTFDMTGRTGLRELDGSSPANQMLRARRHSTVMTDDGAALNDKILKLSTASSAPPGATTVTRPTTGGERKRKHDDDDYDKRSGERGWTPVGEGASPCARVELNRSGARRLPPCQEVHEVHEIHEVTPLPSYDAGSSNGVPTTYRDVSHRRRARPDHRCAIHRRRRFIDRRLAPTPTPPPAPQARRSARAGHAGRSTASMWRGASRSTTKMGSQSSSSMQKPVR